MTADSGSTRNATFTWKLPTAIQSNRAGCDRRSAAGFETRSANTATVTPKAAATVPAPSQPAEVPFQRRPVSRRIAAPARGRAGITGARLIRSSLQQVRVVDVRASPLSVQRHDDGQADHDLGG